MFAIRVGVGGAALWKWWHSLLASPSGEVIEFEPDSNQLIMDVEMEEMCAGRSVKREPIQFKNNRRMPQPLSEKDRSYIAAIIFTSVLAIALIVIAIVMFAFIL